jgi:hypothetical protein
MRSKTETLFEHSTAPKSVKPSGGTKKYRGDEGDDPLPISSDPRVIRGSTVALAKKVAAAKMTKKHGSTKMSRSLGAAEMLQEHRPMYNFEVKGHVGDDIDLREFLVAKDDGLPMQQKNVDTQADIFKARPPSPAYIPRKTGIDCDTQVDDVRELFDFDAESDPIVNVIVAKTLEQALLEVRHEEELKALEEVADDFQAQKRRELEWQKEKEKQTLEEHNAHNKLVKARETEKKNEYQVKSLVGGVAMVQQLMPGLLHGAAEDLYNAGTWRRPERAEVEDLVMLDAKKALRRNYDMRGMAAKMVEEIFLESSKMYEELTHDQKQHRDAPCVILQPVTKPVEVVEEGEAPPPAKRLEEIKIYGAVSLLDVLKAIKNDAAEKEVTTEITLAVLHDFFAGIVGRKIAVDGALVNFHSLLPETISMEI